jgi:hypothetical protein
MSDSRDHVLSSTTDRLDRPQGSWKYKRCLLFIVAAGVVGAGAVMTTWAAGGAVHGAKPTGCGWGELKGDLNGPAKLVLSFDRDLNVQGFFGPSGSGGATEGSGGESVTVTVSRYGSASTYCYKVGTGVECIQY